MFTIKFVEPGREFAVECASYSFKEDSDGIARLLGYDTTYETGDYKALFAGVNAGRGGPGTRSAYVMNRFGSTIANFHWWIENHEGSPLASAAPPPEYGPEPVEIEAA